jgi:pimeloyl-ACP methyl ester carboxylesterase
VPVVAAGDASLHVVQLGAHGARVLMLHGLLLCNVATWYFGVGARLASRHRVVLYDLRGHGRSSRPATGYDLATMAADLGAVIGEDPDPVDLVGHSFGGLVALRYALDHPARVRRLVLVEAPSPPGAPTEIASFLGQDPEAMVEALPPGLRDAVAGGRRQARRLVEHLTGLATTTSVLSDLAGLSAFDPQALATLDLPVLCVVGAHSSCVDAGRGYAQAIPGARLEVLDGGHYLHLDQPDALAACVEAFLDG